MLILSQAVAGQPALLQKYLDIQAQRLHFNGVVLVTQNGKALYHMSTGKASQELNVPMDRDAVFNIASVSKQFTAQLMALAVQEGKLRLRDSLGMFFPELTNKQWQTINLHQLLSHTSGIPHNEGIPDYWTITSRLPLTKEQALAAIMQTRLLFAPGTAMHYSSPGYFLLACILEKAYGQPYEAILKEKVLSPLALQHTGVHVAGSIIPGMVTGYHVRNDSLIAAPFRDFSLMKGSGDLYASAADLAAWSNSFAEKGIWNDSLRRLLFSIHTPLAPNYGYGWYIRSGKRPAYYHGGGSFGCSALSAWYPTEQVAIVILSNVSVLPVNELWNDIEKIVFNEPFELPVIRRSVQLGETALQAFAGKYRKDQQELNIIFTNGQLYAKSGANPPFGLYPENERKLYGKKVNVQFTAEVNDAGTITGLVANIKGQTLRFSKVNDAPASQ